MRHQRVEKWLPLVLGVMLHGLLEGQSHKLRSYEPETLSLKTLDALTDQFPRHAIRLDEEKGLFYNHNPVPPWDITLSGSLRNALLVGAAVSALPCKLILADPVTFLVALEVLMNFGGIGGLYPKDDGFHSSPPET